MIVTQGLLCAKHWIGYATSSIITVAAVTLTAPTAGNKSFVNFQ